MRTEILQYSALNNWPLFALITALIAAAIDWGLSAIELATPQANIEIYS
jgi:hypothetical protein